MALLAGCGSMLRVDTPPAQVAAPARFDASAASGASPTDVSVWWRSWNDPQMDILIDQALAANPDIRIAQSNLAAARAITTVAESVLYPTVSTDATTGAGRADFLDRDPWRALLPPYTSNLPSNASGYGLGIGVTAAWEADVFGGGRANAEAARAAAAISEERLHGAQMLVAAAVAENYRQALALRERLAILDQAIATTAQFQSYVQARFHAGQASAADVADMQANLAGLQAGREPLQALLDSRRRRLAVLSGRPPQQAPELPAAPASSPPPAPVGQVPSTVLERRPDVRARQWAVRARAAQLKGLKADLLPSFGIVFLGGAGRLDFDGIPNIDSSAGLIGLRASLPLFNAGRLRANVRAGDARLEAAVAEHDQIVLGALEEVENAYAMRAALDTHIAELERSREQARRSAESRQALYRAGEITRDKALQARLDLARADDSLAQARMQQAIASIRLYQALGGGWQAARP